MTTQNKIEKYKLEFENDEEIFNTVEIVCPHCFYEQNNKYEITGAYEDGDHSMNCKNCGKEFYFSTDITIRYTSYIDDE